MKERFVLLLNFLEDLNIQQSLYRSFKYPSLEQVQGLDHFKETISHIWW